ncbi:hypothetical protein [Jiella marina]|uniref:hypothetical protein n=1 Tax=Jiella sp. LLJ827 TaxID=2917712 RepID=UPI002100F42F|nr:hypothetical protein [Jiella sp. LLJ827]MCQ0986022.1 hypothetical protein [Jiella sp. LLJ827]
MLTARQLDALEARKESDEALARALAYAKQKRAEERAKILAFVPKHVPADITRLQSISYQEIADRRAEIEDVTKPSKKSRGEKAAGLRPSVNARPWRYGQPSSA